MGSTHAELSVLAAEQRDAAAALRRIAARVRDLEALEELALRYAAAIDDIDNAEPHVPPAELIRAASERDEELRAWVRDALYRHDGAGPISERELIDVAAIAEAGLRLREAVTVAQNGLMFCAICVSEIASEGHAPDCAAPAFDAAVRAACGEVG